MNKKSLFYFFFALLSFSSFLISDQQFENKTIQEITVEAKELPAGSSFKSDSVQNKISTKVGEPFSQTTFDQDLKKLAGEYDRVEPEVKMNGDEVTIVLKVWLRPVISEISWKGDFHYSQNKLEKELDIRPFTAFNIQKFSKGFHKLKEFYVKKGYFEAQLDYEVTKDASKNEVAIEISIREGKSGLIRSISYEGFSKDEITQLKEELHIKAFNPLISWYKGTGIYREDAMDYDKMTLLQFLRNKGYANAKIVIEVLDTPKKNRIDLLVKADRGDLYEFGEIQFEGNKELENEEIQKLISIQKGQPYSPKKVQDTVDQINSFYGKKGYIDATVAYEPRLEENENLYSVDLKITEGKPYKVGLIKVLGNNSTQSKVILRETLLEPGNTFNTNKLEFTQKRLENVQYYKHVNVYASPSSSTKGIQAPVRDVNIEVQEASTGNMALFFGASSVENVFGGLEVSERNFNIAGLTQIPVRGISALRGGGEYFKIKTGLGAKLDDYSLSWTKPYFLDSNWAIGVNINKNISRIQSPNYSIDSFTTNAHSFYSLNPFLSCNFFYRFRNLKLNVDGGAPADLYDQENNNGIVSAVGASLLYNSKNHPHRASSGFESDLKLEYAGVGGKFFFGTFAYNNAYYYPLAKRLVSKTRADFNFILPIAPTKAGTIPLGERFFLGADTSIMRGYRPFSVGPQFGQGEPAGGISSLFLSQELAFNLIPGVDIFTFYDAGSLSLERFKIDRIKQSTGVGARITALSTLPLMLGWGYAINPDNENQRQSFFISMNGTF